MFTISESDLAWLAGVMDSDGSIMMNLCGRDTEKYGKPYYKPKIVFINSNKVMLREIQRIVMGLSDEQLQVWSRKANKENNWKQVFQLSTQKKSLMIAILSAIYPYMVAKKEQARLMLQILLRRTKEYTDRERDFVKEIKQLNKRGYVRPNEEIQIEWKVKQMKKENQYGDTSLAARGESQ